MTSAAGAAPLRRAISKKLRFEIFARDQYACRYCGRSPPTVVLHIDHVVAVIEGGTNVVENLVTACRDCNLGKGRALAPVPSGAPTLQDKLISGVEAREQLSAYRAFLDSVATENEEAVQQVAEFWSAMFSGEHHINHKGLCWVREWLKAFPPEKVFEAMHIAKTRQTDPNEHLKYTGGILRNWKTRLEDPERAASNERLNRALAFWRRMPGGSGYVDRDYIERLRVALNVLGLERVLDEMRAWGRSTYFASFVEHLNNIIDPPGDDGDPAVPSDSEAA